MAEALAAAGIPAFACPPDRFPDLMAATLPRGPGAEAAFARAGCPAVTGAPAWPAYDLQTRATMLIDVTGSLIHDPDRAERETWQSMMPKPG